MTTQNDGSFKRVRHDNKVENLFTPAKRRDPNLDEVADHTRIQLNRLPDGTTHAPKETARRTALASDAST